MKFLTIKITVRITYIKNISWQKYTLKVAREEKTILTVENRHKIYIILWSFTSYFEKKKYCRKIYLILLSFNIY